MTLESDRRMSEVHGSDEESAKEPFCVDLGQEVVEAGVRQGILEPVRHTANGEPVYGFTQAGVAVMRGLLGYQMRGEADEQAGPIQTGDRYAQEPR